MRLTSHLGSSRMTPSHRLPGSLRFRITAIAAAVGTDK